MHPERAHRDRAPLAGINLTPLIDVLLVLVGVLLVLAPHLVKRLPVQLPRTTLNGTPVVEKELQVALAKNGTLLINGHEASLAEVKAHIRPGITTVQIGADKAVSYGTLTALVSHLRSARPKQIVLLTQ